MKSFTNYPSALGALKLELAARVFDPDEYYLIITPDRYTQSVERAMFSGGGALNLEVVTLSRLARRLCGSRACLSREGGVMLTARAVNEVRNDLLYYKRAARFSDFAREAYDTMQQFCASEADAEKLVSASGITDCKLKDMARIRSAYLRLKGEAADPTDRMTELIKAAPTSQLIKKSHVYAIGFALGYRPTELNCSALAAIEHSAKSFTYYDVVSPEDKREALTAFAAPDKAAQYKEIAVRIRDYADRRNGKYGDVYVVCNEPRALCRILAEYGIRFYHDRTTALDVTPPLTALDNIYKLRTAVALGHAADGEAVAALCKNPFSQCDETDAQMLCDALSLRGRYVDLNGTFKDERAERAAARIRQLIQWFDGEFADAVKSVVERGEFSRIHKELYGSDTDMITPIIELAELLRYFGSSDRASNAEAFFSAAHAVSIKSLPRQKDCVTVTVPRALRLTECKMLFVTDFNEGVLPAAMTDTGLFCDEELAAVNRASAPLKVEPTVREQNRRERMELAAVVRNAGEVFCSFVTSGRMRPAAFMSELAHNVKRLSYDEGLIALKSTDNADHIAAYACVPAAARELAARRFTKYSRSIKRAAGECDMRAAEFTDKARGAVKRRISVSELTDWFNCPYKRFLRDVVGVKERKSGALGAPDFGIVVHDFMERFIKAPPYDCSREHISAVIDDVLEQMEIDADERGRARLIDDAVDFAAVNVKILECGKYVPEFFEKPFGGITLGNKHKAEFVGVIDRIDALGSDLRILDYKTGTKEFNIKNCLIGTDMQLPLYAYAVGAKNVTGIFYVKLPPRFDADKKPLDGKYIKDVNVALGYDRSLGALSASSIMSARLKLDKKTGVLSFHDGYKGGMERAEFDALVERCVATASLAVDEMGEGCIARTPIAGSCDRCAFSGICGGNVTERFPDPDAVGGVTEVE